MLNLKQKMNRSRKKWRQRWKKLMTIDICVKTMETIIIKIDVNLLSNKKDYIKWTSESGYMPQKIFFTKDFFSVLVYIKWLLVNIFQTTIVLLK